MRTSKSRENYQLPEANSEVPMETVKEICEVYDLSEIWEKIEKDPPKKPFVSDGCTMWPDITNGISIYEACFLHDLKYWCGHPGEDVARLQADAELMLDVARIRNSIKMAELMFHGVRRGGTEHLKLAFSWGFGRFE